MFKCEREILNKKNMDTLNKLSQSIITLRKNIDKIFEEILLNVDNQLICLKENQIELDKALQSLDLDQYLSQSHTLNQMQVHFDGFQKLCKIQLEQLIQKQNIATCIEEIQKLDNQSIVLDSNISKQGISQVKSEQNYKLSLICPEHNEKITLFNLNESVARENRLVCQECISGKPGAVYTFKDLYKKWEIYKELNNQLTTANSQSTKYKLNLIQTEWKKFEEDIIKVINDNSSIILEKQKHIIELSQSQPSLLKSTWSSLKKEDILSIIDLISQPDHLEKLKISTNQKFDKQNNQIDQIVYQQLSLIEDIKKDYKNNLVKVISFDNNESTIYDSMVSTQTSNTINTIYQQQKEFQVKLKMLEIQLNFRNKNQNFPPKIFNRTFLFTVHPKKQIQKQINQIDTYKLASNIIEISVKVQKDHVLAKNQNIFQLSKQKKVSQKKVISQQSQTLKKGFRNLPLFCLSFRQTKDDISLHQQDKNLNQQQIPEETLNFQLIKQNKIQQIQYCAALAINKEQTFMVAGCNNTIRIFDFQKGLLQDRQLIKYHCDSVYVLLFMRNENQFISGSKDRSIAIWSMNDENKYFCSQELKNAHYSDVNCIVIKENEELMISCSSDKSIKFWIKNELWECFQSIVRHTNAVQSLSLNASQNLLISCGDDKSILVIQQRDDRKWEVIQNISLSKTGFRLSFIGDNFISFQPYNHHLMEIYEFNSERRQFSTQKRNIKVGKGTLCINLFPQIYNSSKQLLISKNGEVLNIIKVEGNGNIELLQSITFGHHYLRGALTDDGELLVTWDFDSKQFQVRKLQISNQNF